MVSFRIFVPNQSVFCTDIVPLCFRLRGRIMTLSRISAGNIKEWPKYLFLSFVM